MGINWLDIVVLIVCVAACIRGFTTGLIMQVATLAGIILGIIFSGKLAEVIYPYIYYWLEDAEHIASPVSYLISFVLILLVVTAIGRIANAVAKVVLLNMVNRIAGAAFCVVKWILIMGILLTVITEFDINKSVIKEEARTRSQTYPALTGLVKMIIPYLNFEDHTPQTPIRQNESPPVESV